MLRLPDTPTPTSRPWSRWDTVKMLAVWASPFVFWAIGIAVVWWALVR